MRVHVLQTLTICTDLDPEANHVDRRGRGVRSNLPESNASRPPLDGLRRSDSHLHEIFLLEPIHTFVGGRDGHHPVHFTRGRRGAGRPPHATVVCFGTTQKPWKPREHEAR